MKLLLAAVGLVFLWSSGFVGATWSADTAPVDTVLAWRTGIAALLLGALVLVRRERLTRAQVRAQAGRGLLVQAVYLGGVFAALAAGVPTGTTALICALQPLLVAGLARPMLGISLGRRKVLGLAVGAAGVGVVVAGDLGGAPAWAFLLPVLAVAGLALGTVLEGRDENPAPLLAGFAVQTATAALVFAAAAAVRGGIAPPSDGAFWWAIVWVVVLSAVGGYGCYLLVVRQGGPTLASALLYLTPPTTALWAWAMFGQQPGPLAVPGVVVTAVGVAIFATRGLNGVSGERGLARRSRPRSAATPASRRPPRTAATRRPQASRT